MRRNRQIVARARSLDDHPPVLNMADLIDEQKETIRRIARIVDNLKKLGAAKMTEGAVRSRLDTLEEACLGL